MRLLIILILWQMAITSYAAEMLTGRAKGAELKALPELCQARFTYGIGGAEFKKWKQVLGEDALHIHHYCAGIAFLNRADRFDEHRGFYLTQAESNFLYSIKASKNPDFVLMPDFFYQMAVVKKKRGDMGEAVNYANQSIQAKKDYLKPYLLLADIYIKNGNKEQAEEVLLEAKKYYPKSRAVKRRLKKIK